MDRLNLLIVITATLCSCASGASIPVDSKPSSSVVASLLKVLNGDFSLDDVHNLKYFFGSGSKGLQKFIHFSPLMQSMVQEATKENIKVKILLTFLSGNAPSLGDFIKLATTKSDSISATFSKMEKTNPKWRTMHKLMKGEQVKNHTAIKEVLEMFAGRKINVNAINLKNDKYTVSERADLAYYNLLKLLYFIGDNYKGLKQMSTMLNTRPANYDAMLPLIVNFDYTSFPTTTVGTNAQKYSVTNAEATTLLNDVKTKYPQILAQHDSKKVADAVLNFVGVFIDVVGMMFGEAENLGQKDTSVVNQ